jgi:hypothetical protein
LARYLGQHPDISCAREKEVGFFSKDVIYSRGPRWYSNQFPSRFRRWRRRLLFEATPEYLYYPWVPDRILRSNSRIKLIAILRDPVSRAFSAWNMFKHFFDDNPELTIRHHISTANYQCREPLTGLLRGRTFPSFRECAEREINLVGVNHEVPPEPSFVRRGLYFEQVKRYVDLVPLDRLLFLEHSELRNDRIATLDRVLHFLGARPVDWSKFDLSDEHVRPYSSTLSFEDRALLADFYRPHNTRVKEFLGTRFGWDGA